MTEGELFRDLLRRITEILDVLSAVDRGEFCGPPHPLAICAEHLRLLLLEARRADHARSRRRIRDSWVIVREVGVRYELFSAYRGNEKARSYLRAFLEPPGGTGSVQQRGARIPQRVAEALSLKSPALPK